MESPLVAELKREEKALATRLEAIRALLAVYDGGQTTTVAEGRRYVKRHTADALDAVLAQAGRPLTYDEAITAILAEGHYICANSRLYVKTLSIVVAMNEDRFAQDVPANQGGKISLTAWKQMEAAG